jgi:oxygen-independent coproporphyrinogen-3 oxidase
VYVHLPWCLRKCPYCDFNSHAVRGEPDFDGYVSALLLDLEAELPLVWGRSVGTVFLGGGTPSLFPARAIGRLLDGIAARLRLAPDAEITLEANPGAAEAARLRDFVAAGVNRLSMGVQSFDDRLLAAIGRVHDGEAARAAVVAAQASGATRVNVDLMFALPGQSSAQLRADLATALELGVRHVSFYQLTLEPGTAFHRRPPRLPGHDRAAAMSRLSPPRGSAVATT